MSKIVVISSGLYTSFCHSIGFLQDISDDLELIVFAPCFNNLLAKIRCKSLSFFRIEKKPTLDTYDFISGSIEDEDSLVLVFSKFLIPNSIYSRFNCINFHPSVLPSFPGLNGYKESLSNRHLGFTAHKIDDSVDQGPRIISCQITPFPTLSSHSIDMISYKMCSLLTASIIKMHHEKRLATYAYTHFSSNEVDLLEAKLV